MTARADAEAAVHLARVKMDYEESVYGGSCMITQMEVIRANCSLIGAVMGETLESLAGKLQRLFGARP